MTAYYNEIDPYAAQWIRNLIAAGHIAAGDVDERSIEDVKPDELMGYTQCHFFAGVGVWSYALRSAGWSDDRQVWTGSCPCQPFSSAGKGAGFNDERHLWPAFQWLIQQCQPPVVFGEQVASKAVEPWIDLVHADLEAMGYAFGCVPFPSAGVGAPHIRDRAYWVAHASMRGRQQQQDARPAKVFPCETATKKQVQQPSADRASLGGVGHADSARLEGLARHGGAERREGQSGSVAAPGLSGGVANTNSDEHGAAGRDSTGDSQTVQGVDCTQNPRAWMHGGTGDSLRGVVDTDQHGCVEGGITATTARHGNTTYTDGGYGRPGPTNGFWADVDWLLCRDGKWRCVEPGTFPLAHGAASRVGRLRAYGNAINAYQAKIFIESALEAEANE